MQSLNIKSGLTLGALASLVFACGAELKSSSAALETRSENSNGPLVVVANFTGSEPEGIAPYTVYIDATNSYSTAHGGWISAFHWDFGDGTSSDNGWVAHTYTRPGTYIVTLTATDGGGREASTTLEILVNEPREPKAVLDMYTPTSGPAPFTVMMDPTHTTAADPRAYIVDFEWDFDDGTPHPHQAWVEHTYTLPGSYRPRVKATDNRGLSDVASVLIEVGCGNIPNCTHVPGQTAWARYLAQTGRSEPQGLAKDSAGNLVVATNFTGSTADFGAGRSGSSNESNKASVAKYNPSGALLWEARLEPEPSSAPTPLVRLDGVTTSPQDEVWVSGSVLGRFQLGGQTFEAGNFLMKLSPSGQLLQQIPLGDTLSQLATAADGSLFGIIGFGFNLVKRDNGGTELWTKRVPFRVYSLDVDSRGNVILGGTQEQRDQFDRVGAVLALSSSDGAQKWLKLLGEGISMVTSVRVSSDGTLAIGGLFNRELTWGGVTLPLPATQPVGGRFYLVGALLVGNVDGSEQWMKAVEIGERGGIAIPFRGYPQVAIHSNGAIAIAQESLVAGVAAVWTYTSAGQRLWYRELGQLPPLHDPDVPVTTPTLLEATTDGFVVGGSFMGSQDFGAGAFANPGPGPDTFLVRLLN